MHPSATRAHDQTSALADATHALVRKAFLHDCAIMGEVSSAQEQLACPALN